MGRQTCSVHQSPLFRVWDQSRETDVDNLEALLKQCFRLLGEMIPYSLYGRVVGLVDVDVPHRPSESIFGKIGVLLAPDRVVEDKDTSGSSPASSFSQRATST